MEPHLFAIIIGVINAIYYLAASGIAVAELVDLARTNEIYNSNDTLITIVCLVLLFSLTMVLICGLMIMGVKKRRSELVAPWVFLSVVSIVGNILELIINGHKLPAEQIFSGIFYIIVQTLIWYPIYGLWRDLRDGDYISIENREPPRQQEQGQEPTTPNYMATAETTEAPGGYQGA